MEISWAGLAGCPSALGTERSGWPWVKKMGSGSVLFACTWYVRYCQARYLGPETGAARKGKLEG